MQAYSKCSVKYICRLRRIHECSSRGIGLSRKNNTNEVNRLYQAFLHFKNRITDQSCSVLSGKYNAQSGIEFMFAVNFWRHWKLIQFFMRNVHHDTGSGTFVTHQRTHRRLLTFQTPFTNVSNGSVHSLGCASMPGSNHCVQDVQQKLLQSQHSIIKYPLRDGLMLDLNEPIHELYNSLPLVDS